MEFVVKKIEQLCTKITDGSHYSPAEDLLSDIPMYSVKDMQYNGFNNTGYKTISVEEYNRMCKADCRPLKNDILIAKDGSYLKNVFKVENDLNAAILSSIAILRPDSEVIDSDYFVYLMRTNAVKCAMASYVSGSALPRIILSDFKKMKIEMIKDIKIQRKIAQVLKKYDMLIENNNKRINLLEKITEEIYKEWFVRFRFPNYESYDFESGVPKDWKIKRVKDFGNVITGKTPSTKVDDYYGDKYLFVKTPDMHDTYFVIDSEEGLSENGNQSQKKCKLPINSIMVSCIGTAGVVSINKKEAHTNQQINSIVLNDSNYLNWLFFTLKSMKDTINMFGSTGATMTNLSKGKFEKLKVLEPNRDLIYLFQDKTSKMFDEIYFLQQINKNLISQRDSLLPRLMNGKIISD